MERGALLLRIVLPLMAVAGASPGTASQQPSASRIEADQILPPSPATKDEPQRKAYLDDALAPLPRSNAAQAPGEQTSRTSAPPPQITAAGQNGLAMSQLAPHELDATLAQLSAAERQVLLQAIAGTDICDNPPDVPAVIALCRTRIETRSVEFGAPVPAISAEEQLIRFDLDESALPGLRQVIERLARGTAATDDFANQAIASIALTGPAPRPAPAPEEKPGEGLGAETQSLINAIINQLGGSPP